MVLSDYIKLRILTLFWKGFKISGIKDILVLEDETIVSRQSIRLFLKRFAERGYIGRKPGSGMTLKLSPAILELIEQCMQEDDETTATQLQTRLAAHNVHVSLSTVLRNRRQLGWIYRGSAYCQLIRNENKQKRLEWAQRNLHDTFEDVIWTDEASIQLDWHKRYSCRKEGERPRPKPRPKHPTKVHVWAGISKKGATGICIFEGKMNAPLFCQILRRTLLPFLQVKFPTPNSHRLMQDNDPKHCSRYARCFYDEVGINWWRTPPESPDLNPIENVWHELKDHLRGVVKPRNKQELIDGILAFWETMDEQKCQKYIGHLKKVIPKVIELNGNATGY